MILPQLLLFILILLPENMVKGISTFGPFESTATGRAVEHKTRTIKHVPTKGISSTVLNQLNSNFEPTGITKYNNKIYVLDNNSKKVFAFNNDYSRSPADDIEKSTIMGRVNNYGDPYTFIDIDFYGLMSDGERLLASYRHHYSRIVTLTGYNNVTETRTVQTTKQVKEPKTRTVNTTKRVRKTRRVRRTRRVRKSERRTRRVLTTTYKNVRQSTWTYKNVATTKRVRRRVQTTKLVNTTVRRRVWVPGQRVSTFTFYNGRYQYVSTWVPGHYTYQNVQTQKRVNTYTYRYFNEPTTKRVYVQTYKTVRVQTSTYRTEWYTYYYYVNETYYVDEVYYVNEPTTRTETYYVTKNVPTTRTETFTRQVPYNYEATQTYDDYYIIAIKGWGYNLNIYDLEIFRELTRRNAAGEIGGTLTWNVNDIAKDHENYLVILDPYDKIIKFNPRGTDIQDISTTRKLRGITYDGESILRINEQDFITAYKDDKLNVLSNIHRRIVRTAARDIDPGAMDWDVDGFHLIDKHNKAVYYFEVVPALAQNSFGAFENTASGYVGKIINPEENIFG